MNTDYIHPFLSGTLESLAETIILGDWHGETGWGLRALRSLHKSHPDVEVLFHVGDFGFYSDLPGRKFLRKVNKLLKEEGKFLLVTLGNHENYTFLEKAKKHPTVPYLNYFPETPHVLFFDRGARWVSHGLSFLSVGGANSISRGFSRVDIDWWESEQITTQDVNASVTGGEVDVLICHDVPAGVGYFTDEDVAATVKEWELENYEYSKGSRVALREVVDAVHPSYIFHGHYHVRSSKLVKFADQAGNKWLSQVECLDKENSREGNAVHFDLSSGRISDILIT